MSKLTRILFTKVVIPNWRTAFGLEFWGSVGVIVLLYLLEHLPSLNFVALRMPTLHERVEIVSSFAELGFGVCSGGLIFISYVVSRNLREAYERNMRQKYYANYFRFTWTMFLHWLLFTMCRTYSLFEADYWNSVIQNNPLFHKLIYASFVFIFCYGVLSTISLVLYVSTLGMFATHEKEREGVNGKP